MAQDLERPAKSKNYFLGYKFVRGAYMEKERTRCRKITQTQFSQTIEATDNNYNAAVDFVLEKFRQSSSIFRYTQR